jgi:hypothetical protein
MSPEERQSRIKLGRRYKSYAAATGISYRYFFEGQHRVVRPEGQGAGWDYTFVVFPDQGPPFTVKVFVAERARVAWQQAHRRALEANEMYAVAKMRLFRAFDEYERLVEERLNLVVDKADVEELLEPLDLT